MDFKVGDKLYDTYSKRIVTISDISINTLNFETNYYFNESIIPFTEERVKKFFIPINDIFLEYEKIL